jgi:hypothetical protein
VPTKTIDTATVMITEMVIVRLRRRPMPISEATNWARMISSGLRAGRCGGPSAGGQAE